jgi:putative ABC transport system permease protein
MAVAMNQILTQSFGADLRADFLDYQSKRVVQSVRTWRGVVWAEGVLELPMDFRHRSFTYSAIVNGIEPESRMKPLVNAQGERLRVSAKGAIFGPTLRNRLHLEVGDKVEIALSENLTRETSTKRLITVAGFCDEAIGTQAYMPRWQLESLFRDDLDLPGNAITGLLMKTDPKHSEEVRKRLLDLPRAASALTMSSMRQMVENLMSSTSLYIRIMDVFGAALAFATIFNMITVNVLERQSEVATLRTLGVSRISIAWMIVVENLLVALIGIAIGLPVSNAFVQLFWKAAQTEQQQDLFTFNVVVLPATNIQAVLMILAVALLSMPPSMRYLSRLDLARAVKERSA